MLQAAGADNLTPWTFQADIMNGTDPSPQDVAAEKALFTQHKVKVFLYNQQVTDALTELVHQPGARERHPGGRRLRDHADPRLRLPVLDDRRGQRPGQGRDRQGLHGAPVSRPTTSCGWTNIGVRLGGRQILSDVSFAVAPGEFTGLIGPNGAGKTTLLRVILGLTPPTEGRVLLNGSPKTRHGGGLIGYVPQKLAIDQDMPLRARDVVGLGIDGTSSASRCRRRAGGGASPRRSRRSARRAMPMRGSANCPAASSSAC